MMFFEDVHGNHYPVSRIRKIVPGKRNDNGWRGRARIELDLDLDIAVDAHEVDRIVANGEPVIAAYPGFDHLMFWYDPKNPDREPWISISPVIGWRDTADEGVAAVTIEDRRYMWAPQAIRLPSGVVTAPEEATWDSLEYWVADKKREADEDFAAAQEGAGEPSQG